MLSNPFIAEIGRIIQESKELTSQIKIDEESKVVSEGINFIKIMTAEVENLLEEIQLEGIEQE